MNTDVVDILQTLVRIPSVNPMGRNVSGEQYFEHRVTDFLQDFFQKLGVTWRRQLVAPKRDNILARLDGSAPGGKILMFEAHQDTVPVDGMSIPPWEASLRAGRVYGRGACDIKGGMACMLAAFARLAAELPPNRPTLVMAASVNEEYGFSGASQMNQMWAADHTQAFLPRPPDAVLVAEPTELDVVVAHKGVLRWRCHARGRAAHSSQPERGENAIYHMARVIAALEAYARDVLPQVGHHGRLGRPTLSVGLIQGGVSVNTVPDQCTIEIDRRLLPDEDPQEAFRQATAYLSQQLGGVPVEHERPYLAAGGLSEEGNAELADRLGEVIRQCGGPGRKCGVPFGTDAPAFAASSPTVVFGPGAIDQAHTADEWIAVDQLQQATEVYYQCACVERNLFRSPAG